MSLTIPSVAVEVELALEVARLSTALAASHRRYAQKIVAFVFLP